MDNPEECSVCFTTFDESVCRPRTLPCGHTFCSPCVGDLIEAGILSCPSCQATHPATSVTQFPISYGIEAMTKKLKALKSIQALAVQMPAPAAESGVTVATTKNTSLKQSTGIRKKLQAILEEQKNSVSSLVTGCQQVQCQLVQYRVELKEWRTQHLHLLGRLDILVEQHKAALKLLEQEDTRVLTLEKECEVGLSQLEVVLGCLQAVTTPEEILSAINQADYNTEAVDDWKQMCHELFPDERTVITSRKVREDTQMALETLGVDYGATEDGATQDSATQYGATQDSATQYGATHDGVTQDRSTEDGATEPLLDRQNSTIMEMVKEIRTLTKLSNVEDLQRMSSPIRRLVETGQVYGIQQDQNGVRSSKITLDGSRVYLHCLISQPPPRHVYTLPVSEMVGGVDPSSSLVFLDLAWGGTTRGRVHIRLSPPDTPLARQFVLLCSGQRGPSYHNTILLDVWQKGDAGECVVGGDYQHNNGKGGAPLLPHSLHQQYRKSDMEGDVWARWWPSDSCTGAQFAITTKKRDWLSLLDAFGEVESGMEVVRAAVTQGDITRVTVVDCGVVVNY